MPLFIVTVKLPRNKDHDPNNKVTGVCPLPGHGPYTPLLCTDVTGQHHTEVVDAGDVEEILDFYSKGTHITRIEAVPSIFILNM